MTLLLLLELLPLAQVAQPLPHREPSHNRRRNLHDISEPHVAKAAGNKFTYFVRTEALAVLNLCMSGNKQANTSATWMSASGPRKRSLIPCPTLFSELAIPR